METWKQIQEFNKYEVSDYGRIRNKKTMKVLIPGIQNSGYCMVSLRKDGKSYSRSIHRIVMETFNPIEHANKYDVNHKDWDKTNNRLDNLEWVTHSENLLHGSGPTELKVLEAMICNSIKAALHKWYDLLLTAKCTKEAFNEKIVMQAVEEAAKYFNKNNI